jgi:integrase
LKLPCAEVSRDRVLSEAELRLVLLGSQALETPWREFARLLIYTATRRNEVAAAPWVEFTGLNTSDPRWEIPGERTKNGRPLLLPLPLDAARMLDEMPRIGEKGLAFTVTGETPVMGFSDAKERLDAAMLAIARKEAAERGEDPEKVQPLPRWTWHDLRRTAATGMAGLGVQPHVIEAVLNHVSGAKAGVAGIYNRHAYFAEKKAALALWAKHVAVLEGAAPANENVVALYG